VPGPEPLIRIRDLRYRYPGTGRDVLNIPFLDVSGRGLIAITGPSGVGKTTLVELLAGTLREDYQGSVVVLGKEWKDLRKDAGRQYQLRRIGLIPQDFGLLPGRTPAELLVQDLADSGVPPHEREARAAQALGQVEMTEFAERQVSGLSGGQKQRAAVARMLARDVDLVIADEPTANLDAALLDVTISLLRRLAARVPVIVVTHDPQVAEACDRTIVLQSAAVMPPGQPTVPVAQARRRVPPVAIAAGIAVLVMAGATAALLLHHASTAGGQAASTATNAAALPPASAPAQAAPSSPAAPTQQAVTPPAAPQARPASGITATLAAYFNAINAQDYRLAWHQLSPANQANNSYPQFAAGESTTFIPAWKLHGIAAGAHPGSYIAFVTFKSYQSPSQAPNHQDTCDVWSLDYTMIPRPGRWLISNAAPHPGVPEYRRCA
jgi:putative ABC transport system ATP-binding protein